MASSVWCVLGAASSDVCVLCVWCGLGLVTRLDGVDCVEPGRPTTTSWEPLLDTELPLFLWRPGEAEAVLLCLGRGWNRSEDSPGLDRALVAELTDQVDVTLLL